MSKTTEEPKLSMQQATEGNSGEGREKAQPSTVPGAPGNMLSSLPSVDLSGYIALSMDQSDLREVIQENIGEFGGLSIFDLTRIRVPTGGGVSWEVDTLEGTKSMQALEAVVVGWKDVRMYWRIAFDESGGGSPPDCQSNDMMEGIGNPGGPCDRCPLNQFGSDSKSKRGKACKETRILYLLQRESLMPAVLMCPPTSLKSVRQYFNQLTARGARYFSVLTSFKLHKDKNDDGVAYSKIIPTFVGRLEQNDLTQVATYVSMLKGAVRPPAPPARAISHDSP